MAEQLHPEDIYQTLEYEIVTLKIKPGETISENQLCKRFGISRTGVRCPAAAGAEWLCADHSLQGHHRHPH